MALDEATASTTKGGGLVFPSSPTEKPRTEVTLCEASNLLTAKDRNAK